LERNRPDAVTAAGAAGTLVAAEAGAAARPTRRRRRSKDEPGAQSRRHPRLLGLGCYHPVAGAEGPPPVREERTRRAST
jgi:hypothetical protein